jgi:hypothetical protein
MGQTKKTKIKLPSYEVNAKLFIGRTIPRAPYLQPPLGFYDRPGFLQMRLSH